MRPRFTLKQGFSIVEGMIAVTLISVGLIAVLSLINSSLRLPAIAKDEFLAANLAQEGIEIVRAIRDENWIGGNNFDQNLPEGKWRVHYLETRLLPLSSNPPLLFDPTTGFFQYNSGSETKFRRQINIDRVSDRELRVSAAVTWESRGIPSSLTVEDHLFDWLRRQ